MDYQVKGSESMKKIFLLFFLLMCNCENKHIKRIEYVQKQLQCDQNNLYRSKYDFIFKGLIRVWFVFCDKLTYEFSEELNEPSSIKCWELEHEEIIRRKIHAKEKVLYFRKRTTSGNYSSGG